jgi:hypothetical protein
MPDGIDEHIVCDRHRAQVRRRYRLTISLSMTLQEAKSIARLTLRLLRSGKYRVNFRDGNETTAYYTDDLEDAVNTAVEMAHKRAL